MDVVLDHNFKAYPNVGCIVHYDNKCIQLYWNSIVIASSSLTKEQLHSTIESVLYMLSHHQKAKDTRDPQGILPSIAIRRSSVKDEDSDAEYHLSVAFIEWLRPASARICPFCLSKGGRELLTTV